MEFKKTIFVLTITSILIICGLFGTSYAYYVSSDGTSFNITTANTDLENEVTVTFEQSQYINFRAGVPITALDVTSKASKNVFTFSGDSTYLSGYDVAVNIYLTDIQIAEALKVSDFKYQLVCSKEPFGGGVSQLVPGSSGDGTDFTSTVLSNDKLPLLTLTTTDNSFEFDKTYTCTLSVWLQESNADQNALMNKKFSGLIRVGSVYRK